MLAVAYCLGCAILLAAALAFPPGPAQLVLLGLAIFLAAATTGPAGAMVADLTPGRDPRHGVRHADPGQ